MFGGGFCYGMQSEQPIILYPQTILSTELFQEGVIFRETTSGMPEESRSGVTV